MLAKQRYPAYDLRQAIPIADMERSLSGQVATIPLLLLGRQRPCSSPAGSMLAAALSAESLTPSSPVTAEASLWCLLGWGHEICRVLSGQPECFNPA